MSFAIFGGRSAPLFCLPARRHPRLILLLFFERLMGNADGPFALCSTSRHDGPLLPCFSRIHCPAFFFQSTKESFRLPSAAG
ncbi:MAG: hypothetical protein C4293_19010 [Nitrospiraceae bacterium]